MQIIDNPVALASALASIRLTNNTIGFVPTMGALHAGHASLVKKSVAENKLTIASIFVNPTQFGPNEDLAKYPRTLEADAEMLRKEGVDFLFAPTLSSMYPESEFEVSMNLRTLDKVMDGAKRPGHFQGVMLIVSMLFNIVRPTKAYFGQKDFQQLAVIRAMTRELFFPVEIIGCPTVREPDGLAMSSRNRFLNETERREALFLSRALFGVKSLAENQPKVSELLASVATLQKDFPGVRLEYFDIRNGDTLMPLELALPENNPVALVAAFVGNTRLIDNMALFS